MYAARYLLQCSARHFPSTVIMDIVHCMWTIPVWPDKCGQVHGGSLRSEVSCCTEYINFGIYLTTHMCEGWYHGFGVPVVTPRVHPPFQSKWQKSQGPPKGARGSSSWTLLEPFGIDAGCKWRLGPFYYQFAAGYRPDAGVGRANGHDSPISWNGYHIAKQRVSTGCIPIT